MKFILSIAGLIFVTNILAQNNLVQNTTILEETYEIEAINDDVITKYAHLLDSLFESGIPAELTITVNPKYHKSIGTKCLCGCSRKSNS